MPALLRVRGYRFFFFTLEGASRRISWESIGGGIGVHWEAIDEDISVASLPHPEAFVRLPGKIANRG